MSDTPGEPCEECREAQKKVAIIAAVVGAALGVGVAFVVLKNG